MRRHPAFWLMIIVIVALIAAVFVYPHGWGAKAKPWQLGLDLEGGAHLVYSIDLSKVDAANQDSVVSGLRDVIDRRVNLFGVGEPQVYTAQGSNGTAELDVDLPGVKDIADAINQIGQTPQLVFAEVDTIGSSTQYVPTNLDGEYITGAQLIYDQTTGQPEVDINFNSEGGDIFAKITAANVGKPLAIFLDNQLIEAPVVQQVISGGQATISGSFTIASATELVGRFNAGALPAPITLINQQTVSATLGGNSLQEVIVAGIIGTLLVILFMLFYYRRLGIFAALSLIIYIALTLGVFKLLGITLSLAGLAGFVLTIGMAVDANILIFERMKEELRRGLPRASAVEEGFRRAWPSIRDANISTIITAAILYFFTSSFVQGFAITLFIGVVISLFSAITTTRLFLRIFMSDTTKPQLAKAQA
jgi:protein-export SecD/SecF family membrane protein